MQIWVTQSLQPEVSGPASMQVSCAQPGAPPAWPDEEDDEPLELVEEDEPPEPEDDEDEEAPPTPVDDDELEVCPPCEVVVLPPVPLDELVVLPPPSPVPKTVISVLQPPQASAAPNSVARIGAASRAFILHLMGPHRRAAWPPSN